MKKKNADIPFLNLALQYASMRGEIDAALARVLESGQFIGGEEVAAFEQEISLFCGSPHAVALNSGTDALFLALKALGIGPGDEVITTPFTYIATASSIVNAGATPVFADVHPGTFNLDAARVEAALTPRTRAVLPVHLFGQVAEDMEEISHITREQGLFIIEDAAQAMGAERRGKKAGSFGHAACFSFFPTKNLGAYGDGGMLLTKRGSAADLARMYARNGGDLKDKYLNRVAGINSRLDALQAAILRAKLPHLDAWNNARRRIAARYGEKLKGVPGIRVPEEAEGNTHVFHQYTIRVPKRDELREHLRLRGIQTFVFYGRPLHLQPAMRFLGYKRGAFPHAEQAAGEVISLPVFPEMTDEEQDRVVEEIVSFFA